MKESSDNAPRPRSLEEVFRDGFKPAEVTPPAPLWHRIEQELEGKQTGYYKQRLIWYRRVAAASILLLLLATAYFWYDTQTAHQTAVLPPTADSAARRPASNLPAPATKKPIDQPVAIIRPEPVASSTITGAENKSSSTSSARKVTAPQPNPTKDKGIISVPLRTVPATNPRVSPLPDTASWAGAAPQLDSVATLTKPLVAAADSAVTLPAAAAPVKNSEHASLARWALGGGAGWQYFQQNIKFGGPGNARAYQPNSNANLKSLTADQAEFNQNTRAAFSYRAALTANYTINARWSLETGLTFAQNKAQTTTSYIIDKWPTEYYNYNMASLRNSDFFLDQSSNGLPNTIGIPVTSFLAQLTDRNASSNTVNTSQVAPFNVYYRYRQVGVPIKLRYQWADRDRWFTFAEAGGAVNLLLQTSILADSPRVPEVAYTIGRPSPFRKWYATAVGSVGRGWRVSQAWQVQGSLEVARNFSSLTLAPDQLPQVRQGKAYSVGIGLSSSYRLGKKTANGK